MKNVGIKDINKWIYKEKRGYNWSNNTFDTEEEAVTFGIKDLGYPFYVGIVKEGDMPKFSGEAVIEDLKNEARRKYNDYADAWLEDVSSVDMINLENQLNATLLEWMERTGHNPGFVVIHAKEVKEEEKN